jgi:hypothetical protein
VILLSRFDQHWLPYHIVITDLILSHHGPLHGTYNLAVLVFLAGRHMVKRKDRQALKRGGWVALT